MNSYETTASEINVSIGSAHRRAGPSPRATAATYLFFEPTQLAGRGALQVAGARQDHDGHVTKGSEERADLAGHGHAVAALDRAVAKGARHNPAVHEAALARLARQKPVARNPARRHGLDWLGDGHVLQPKLHRRRVFVGETIGTGGGDSGVVVAVAVRVEEIEFGWFHIFDAGVEAVLQEVVVGLHVRCRQRPQPLHVVRLRQVAAAEGRAGLHRPDGGTGDRSDTCWGSHSGFGTLSIHRLCHGRLVSWIVAAVRGRVLQYAFPSDFLISLSCSPPLNFRKGNEIKQHP